MLDEAYAGPCAIARDPRPSRKVVSTLQVSRFMARQVHDGIPGNAAVGSTPERATPGVYRSRGLRSSRALTWVRESDRAKSLRESVHTARDCRLVGNVCGCRCNRQGPAIPTRSASLPRFKLSKSPSLTAMGWASAPVPREQSGPMRLPRRDVGEHPLAAPGAFRYRPAILDLPGRAPVDRERQRDQAVGSARRTKDLHDGSMVPRTHTFHVSVRKPFARPRRRRRAEAHTKAGEAAQSARRPANARAMVSSSAYSRSEPAGRPCAGRETVTPRLASRSAT